MLCPVGWYTRKKIFPSTSYVTGRGVRKVEDGMGMEQYRAVQGRIGFFPYALSLGGLPLPPLITSDWLARWTTTFVFVTFDEARKYFATSVDLWQLLGGNCYFRIQNKTAVTPPMNVMLMLPWKPQNLYSITFLSSRLIVYRLTQLRWIYNIQFVLLKNHNMFRPFYLVIIRWYTYISSALLNCKMMMTR
jgi:hypothetical protein